FFSSTVFSATVVNRHHTASTPNTTAAAMVSTTGLWSSWPRIARITATSRIQPRLTGISTFQPNAISWSYRTRGSEARTQTKKEKTSTSLMKNQSIGHQPVFAPSHSEIGHGARQPPRNSVIEIAETVNMLMYSASMNRANFSDEEYSVWKPPTSSPSPSGRSKGSRFVSPNIVIT